MLCDPGDILRLTENLGKTLGSTLQYWRTQIEPCQGLRPCVSQEGLTYQCHLARSSPHTENL